jgi:methylthioribose-1-phosphate isomerase
VVAPLSTFDEDLHNGKDIPIEFRDKDEITRLYFRKPIAPEGINIFNPAFDVTDADFVTAFITEKGIIRPPFSKNIRKIINAKRQ